MNIKKPVVDYRKLRFSNINSPQYNHLYMLLYWVFFGVMFLYAERFYPVARYNVMYHPIDDMIPFNELFVIPYVFWFVYMIGMHIYTAFYDIDAFKKLMKYIAVTYTIGLIIFFIYPTSQQLRPAVMPRDNFLTRFMMDFYNFDTSTNVCPSLHVVGSMAVMYTAWNTKGLQSKKWKITFAVITFFISISTVFLKQHSILDVLTALPICMIAYPLCFKDRKQPQTAGNRLYRKTKIKYMD